jgi:EpsI family protein
MDPLVPVGPVDIEAGRMTPLQHRTALLCAILLAGVVIVRVAAANEQTPPRDTLADLPAHLGAWTPAEDIEIDEESLKVLNADDYVSRTYVKPSTALRTGASTTLGAGAGSVDLFIAYYGSQRQGGTMHSPLNCLPATGWQPLSSDDMSIDASPWPVSARRVVIQKGLSRQLVIYWYQSHGRSVASEYSSKAHLVFDSIRQHRSDAAIVRVVSSVDGEAAAIDFIRSLQPILHRYIPD